MKYLAVLDVICLPGGKRDILRRRRKVILYSPLKLREAQYNSAAAEYHCEAIKLAEGEYS